MPIQILSTFTRIGEANYPLVDDGDVKGGFRIVGTIIARDAIPSNIRKEGMRVYITTTSQEFRLNPDLVTWTELTPPGPPPPPVNIGNFSCPATVAVLDAVYLSSADNVDKAEADTVNVPCVGFVTEKPTATTCKVQYGGELGGFVGLVPGATYFLSIVAGQIVVDSDPNFPTVTGSTVQEIGFARNATTLVIVIDRDFTVL